MPPTWNTNPCAGWATLMAVPCWPETHTWPPRSAQLSLEPPARPLEPPARPRPPDMKPGPVCQDIFTCQYLPEGAGCAGAPAKGTLDTASTGGRPPGPNWLTVTPAAPASTTAATPISR